MLGQENVDTKQTLHTGKCTLYIFYGWAFWFWKGIYYSCDTLDRTCPIEVIQQFNIWNCTENGFKTVGFHVDSDHSMIWWCW